MTNDAKLGMLAGVIGVVLAAVFLTKQPAPPAAEEQQLQPRPVAVSAASVRAPNAGAPASAARPDAKPDPFPSTPVVRTRKEPVGVPASRQAGALLDEEP